MSANPLETYAALLRKWNKAINLVSPKTLDDLEERHIKDSQQILQYLPAHPVTIMDWGSGGGLPGMVLALSRLDDTVHFIESDGKKCEFLRHVSRETCRDIFVHTQRIEMVQPKEIKPDIITARALAPLDVLLGWMLPWAQVHPNVEALFQKGKSWVEELRTAQKNYDFQYDIYPSETEKEACIIRIKNLTKRL